MLTFDGIIPVQCKFMTLSEFNVICVQFHVRSTKFNDLYHLLLLTNNLILNSLGD